MKYSVAIIAVYHRTANEVKEQKVFDTLTEATQFVNDWNALQFIQTRTNSDPIIVAMNPLPFGA
jgi:hypothetical protein